MPPKAKKIIITTESRERHVVRPLAGTGTTGFCQKCGAATEWLALDDAVSFSGCATRALVGLIDAGALHADETASGHLLVCRASLEELGQKKKNR